MGIRSGSKTKVEGKTLIREGLRAVGKTGDGIHER